MLRHDRRIEPGPNFVLRLKSMMAVWSRFEGKDGNYVFQQTSEYDQV
jgi:hypothetical protein